MNTYCLSKNTTYTVAVAVATSIMLMGILFFKVGRIDEERSADMHASTTQLGWTTNSNLEHDFHEEQSNQLRMLQKRFDGLESTVAKIDLLESALEKVQASVEGLHRIVAHGNNNDSAALNLNPVPTVEHAPMQCQYENVQGTWSPSWKWLNQGCSTEIEQQEMDACLAKFQKIVFLGDSQMYHIERSFLRSKTFAIRREIKSGGRCGLIERYLGFKAVSPEKLVSANHQNLEGPIAYGKLHPGCTDCAGCNPNLVNCSVQGHPVLLEYFPVEFTRDVEHQSTEANTTQENIALYLSRTKEPPSAVIFSVGLHDVMILDVTHNGTDKMTDEEFNRISTLYKQNLKWFAGVLTQMLPSSKFIFLTTSPRKRPLATSTKDGMLAPGNRTNLLIERMNDQARETVQELGFKILDAYPLLASDLGQQLYTDHVHAHGHGSAFYNTIRNLLVRKLCYQ